MIAATTLSVPTSRQWLSAILRAIANRLDGATIKEPTPAEIKRQKLHEAQLSLIDAEGEAERANHTVAMLRERIARLGGTE